MRNFREELKTHRIGAESAALTGALYLLLHFFAPFLVRTHALLYDLLFEAALATLAGFAAVAILRRRQLQPVTQGVWFALTLAVAFLYVVAIPTVLDRSVSVYILSRIDPERPVAAHALAKEIERGYFEDYAVVETRLREQRVSGNIEQQEGIVSLTPRGAGVVALTARYKALLASKYGR